MMRWGWLCLCLYSTLVFAEQLKQIQNHINQLISKHSQNINIGVAIKDLNTGRIVYQKNAHHYFTPASNMKLYTDGAALLKLGPDYHFYTTLLTDAQQINGQELQGNLYLVFDGDPSLSSARLKSLMQHLTTLGIHAVAKKIILVSKFASAKPYGPGWMLDDTTHDYGAPVAPFVIDQNTVAVTLSPAMANGRRARLVTSSVPSISPLINRVKTISNTKVHCGLKFEVDEKNNLSANGCLPLSTNSFTKSLAIKSSTQWAKAIVAKVLANLEIEHAKNAIEVGTLEPNAKLIAWDESPALSEIITHTLKVSDNSYADSLFLKLADYAQRPVTWRTAGQQVKRLLRQFAGIDLTKAVIVDGSGLSRYNLVTPMQTLRLLDYLYTNFAISHEYISALPIAGRDGTLRKRLLGSTRVDRVRAKTGSMRGIVSLAGFLTSKNKHTLAFAMMQNGIPGNGRQLYRYRKLEDAICDYLTHTSIQSPILNRKTKTGPWKALPYEVYANYQQRHGRLKGARYNLERQLRQALKHWPVDLYRKHNTLIIHIPSKTLKSANNMIYIKKIKKILHQNQFWALLESPNDEWLKTAKSTLGDKDSIVYRWHKEQNQPTEIKLFANYQQIININSVS